MCCPEENGNSIRETKYKLFLKSKSQLGWFSKFYFYRAVQCQTNLQKI